VTNVTRAKDAFDAILGRNIPGPKLVEFADGILTQMGVDLTGLDNEVKASMVLAEIKAVFAGRYFAGVAMAKEAEFADDVQAAKDAVASDFD